MAATAQVPPPPAGDPHSQFLCLTILGYRKPDISEEQYRHHMIHVTAPMTKDLMAKYGIKRWTMIHNNSQTRQLLGQLDDPHLANLSDYDCFSQVVFKTNDDFKRMRDDPVYRERLANDHENFADTQRSKMTIGWITELVRDGQAVDGLQDSPAL